MFAQILYLIKRILHACSGNSDVPPNPENNFLRETSASTNQPVINNTNSNNVGSATNNNTINNNVENHNKDFNTLIVALAVVFGSIVIFAIFAMLVLAKA